MGGRLVEVKQRSEDGGVFDYPREKKKKKKKRFPWGLRQRWDREHSHVNRGNHVHHCAHVAAAERPMVTARKEWYGT